MLRQPTLPEPLVLLLICLGFSGSQLAYRIFYPDNFGFLISDELVLGFVAGVSTFWIAVKIANKNAGPLRRSLDQLRIGVGFNLISQAFFNYLGLLTRSLCLIVVGGLMAASLLGAGRFLARGRAQAQSGVLHVGVDCLAAEAFDILPYPVVGIVGERSGRSAQQERG